MHIIFGIIVIAVGAAVTIKSEWMLSNFGRIPFFEQRLGAEGGSRLGWQLLGVLVIFIGILIFANLIGSFLGWILEPLIRYSGNI